jgi:hypothetical protein
MGAGQEIREESPGKGRETGNRAQVWRKKFPDETDAATQGYERVPENFDERQDRRWAGQKQLRRSEHVGPDALVRAGERRSPVPWNRWDFRFDPYAIRSVRMNLIPNL